MATSSPSAAGPLKSKRADDIGDVKVVNANLIPPLNFALVQKGLYRSGYPNQKNFPFLLQLKIKTVLYLGTATYVEENQAFLHDHGIKLYQCPIDGNKEPFQSIPAEVVREALLRVLDERNHPMLIHCFKGKHQTGCVIGCLRKLQSWSLASIFAEYRQFCGSMQRSLDYQFIELFAPSVEGADTKHLPDWIDFESTK